MTYQANEQDAYLNFYETYLNNLIEGLLRHASLIIFLISLGETPHAFTK
jgi:hypothetical protein